jgi:putative transposase
MTNGMRTGTGAALWVGDRIRFDGQLHTVVGLSGTIVRLADADGQTWVIHLPHLLADPSFEPTGQREPGPVLPAGLLNGLPQQAVEAAKWWERQLVEVLTGLPPDAPPEARPRSQFDPATRTLKQREQAKAKDLTALGHQGVGASTIRRKRRRYQAQGLAGLVDWRADRQRPVQGRTDQRVLEALRQAIDEATERSTRTAGYFYWRVQQLLTAQHGAGVVPMPSRATFYRLFERLSQGRHTTGSARTRRSLANRPDGPFGELVACRPGELVEIDSTPLDVLVLLDEGARASRTDRDGGPCDPLDPRSGAAAHHQVGGRGAVACPHSNARAHAARLGGGAADVPLGAAVPPATGVGPTAGACRRTAAHHARDHRL